MISDSHTDFITELKSTKEKEQYVKDINRWGAKTICSAVFTTQDNLTLKKITKYKKEIDELKTKYGVNFIFAVEDLGFLRVEEIDDFIKLKPFSTTLTWNFDNNFAGGANSNSGLTRLGKRIIKVLEQNNIVIDTAHLNRKSFWQFARFTTKPIFNSHSNIYTLHRHKRNLTNKQIKKIVETNGYLGITIYDEFIAGKQITSLDIAKQFDYLINKFGSLNFGFGTDFYGIDKLHLPIDIKNYKDLQKTITKHLKQMGHNKEVVENIMYKNFESFVKRQQKTEQ